MRARVSISFGASPASLNSVKCEVGNGVSNPSGFQDTICGSYFLVVVKKKKGERGSEGERKDGINYKERQT